MSYQYPERLQPGASAGKSLMKSALLNLFTFLLVVVMFGFGCKFSTDAEPQTAAPTVDSASKKAETPQPQIEAVPSREIVEAFKKDKDAARLYRGKTVTIRGNVTNINEFAGIANLNLRENDNEIGLACWLKNKADKERVKVGDTVVVRANIEDTDFGVVSGGEILQIN